MIIPIDITYYSSPSKCIRTSHSAPITELENVVRCVCLSHRPDLTCDTCPLKGADLINPNRYGWDKCSGTARSLEEKLQPWNSYEDQRAASHRITDILQRIDSDPYCELHYVTPQKSLLKKLRSFCIFLNENFLRR